MKMESRTRDRHTLTDRFERVVGLFPDKTAVVAAGASLTFRKLASWVDNVAALVVEHGVRRGDRVVLLVEDELMSPALVLGLGKAAAVGVRLWSSDPDDLLRDVIEDSGARLILSCGENLDLAERVSGKTAHVAHMDPRNFDAELQLTSRAAPGDRSWIAYTSGSTGRPKGVVHTCGSVLSFLDSYVRRTGLSADDRVARLHLVRGVDMLSSIITGATCFEYDLPGRGFSGIGRWLGDNRISVLPTIPSMLRYIVADLRSRPRSLDLRLLRLSGEPLTRDEMIDAAEVLPADCRIINWYGSTEVAVASRTFGVGDLAALSRVSAGRPFDDIRVEIFDEDGAVLPVGETGEIVVSGAGLFEAYWNRPDLNEAAFTVDASGEERAFRTGDTGYLDARGELTVSGRLDGLVKISGFRVGPGEVEAALLAVEVIREAAVVPIQSSLDGHCITELVAFLVQGESTLPTVAQLRARLAESLPNYKVPSYFVRVDTIPRLVGGKVDRQALHTTRPLSRANYNP